MVEANREDGMKKKKDDREYGTLMGSAQWRKKEGRDARRKRRAGRCVGTGKSVRRLGNGLVHKKRKGDNLTEEKDLKVD